MMMSPRHSFWLLLLQYCLFSELPAVYSDKTACCGKTNEKLQCIESTVVQVPKPFPNRAGWCPGIAPPKGTGVTKLDTSGSDISQLKNDVFDDYPNVLTLRMDHCNISVVRANAFCRPGSISRLQYLSLRNSNIRELHADAFAGLTSLRYLHLGENQLESLPVGVFAPLVKLTELWVNGNKLTRLDAEHFSSLVSLKKLYLSSNSIEKMEPFSASLKHLEELRLEDNKIMKLDLNLLKNLRNLTSINLSKNKLTYIDECFFDSNPNIYRINLRNNELIHLPRTTFQHLCKLSWLDIGNNKLATPYFEWFANVVHQSKFYSSSTISYPDNSGNHWNCDCDAAPYADFMTGICYDPHYPEKGLMDYLNIQCSPGNKIVQRNNEACSHTLTSCGKGFAETKQITNASCLSTPLCRYLTKTCGGNVENKRCKIGPSAPEKSAQTDHLHFMVFGCVIVIIASIGGLLWRIGNKRKAARKRRESDLSSEESENNNEDDEITLLSESDGYVNGRPDPVGGSEDSSSTTHSIPSPDCFYGREYDPTTPLVPNRTEYDSVCPEDTSFTLPKSPFGVSNTNIKELFGEPDVVITQTEVRIHGNRVSVCHQNLGNDYTPMRSLLNDVLARTRQNDEAGNVPMPENLSNASSYLPGHKYEVVSSTDSNGYEIPIRQPTPPSPPSKRRHSENGPNQRLQNDVAPFPSQPDSKNKKAAKKKVTTKKIDEKSNKTTERRK